MDNPLTFKDTILNFFLDPSKDKLRELLKAHLGESAHLEFKQAWPDYPKLAKTILAFSNTDSGVIVIGVEEQNDGALTPIGLDQFKDKSSVVDQLEKYLPPILVPKVAINDFDYTASEYDLLVGRRFQTISVVADVTSQPYISKGQGKDIAESRIYVRREGKNDEANGDDISRIIERRIAAIRADPLLDLDSDLKELQTLYKNTSPKIIEDRVGFFSGSTATLDLALGIIRRTNPDYPEETYERFVGRMIEKKKAKIEAAI